MFRSHFRKLALGGCLLQSCFSTAGPPSIGEPARLPLPSVSAAPNQQMADNIAQNINQSGRLRHYSIDVAFQDGIAELSGTVADQPQREEAVRLVQGISGVIQVRDRLAVAGAVTQTQVAEIPPPKLPAPLPGPLPPGPVAPPQGAANGTPEPVPIFQAPMPGPFDMGQPKMPPNAWPTYAPYNNFSRVAYPEAYPYQAFPFIGPCYPFPKVPTSWRSTKLEWQDGHWWYSTHATKYDLWRLRYW